MRNQEPAEPDRRLSATRDHAAIVIQHEFAAEPWNRALDRPIDVGTSSWENWIDGTFDTTPQSIHVIGDFLLVAWSCHEFCSAMATILDARGRPTRSPDLPIQPVTVRKDRFDSVVSFRLRSRLDLEGRSDRGGYQLPTWILELRGEVRNRQRYLLTRVDGRWLVDANIYPPPRNAAARKPKNKDVQR